MDPLSDVLSLLKPRSYMSGGFAVTGKASVQFPNYEGIKCYAMVAGECWLSVEGMAEAILVRGGDCFLLPRGLPFRLTTDLSLKPVDYREFLAPFKSREVPPPESAEGSIVGGHFLLTGSHAEVLLKALPPVVHIRKEADKAAMRWSLERMREELRSPQPGGALIAQHLAYVMLVQALRLHLEGTEGTGWLFALTNKQMSAAIACMHDDPAHPWTLEKLAERAGMSRSAFALRFKETVGSTPMEYLTRWRMLMAGDRLTNTGDSICEIAASLGYASDSAFGTAFRRVLGSSPRQYSGHTGERRPTSSLRRTGPGSG